MGASGFSRKVGRGRYGDEPRPVGRKRGECPAGSDPRRRDNSEGSFAVALQERRGDDLHRSHQGTARVVVLYADDSSVARLQIESVLTRLGLPFVSTKTGKEAWNHLKTLSQEAQRAGIPLRQKVAMVLTDLEMPEMDGFTLTRQIKEDDVLKSVPVVIHSSLSGSANESHAKSVGADGYVAKFVPDELAREVSKI